ncbi:uncharacterized protein VP01_8916g1, partial [Puccinia sorghi]
TMARRLLISPSSGHSNQESIGMIFNLTSLLQKDTPFLFTEQSLKEFEALEKAFTTAPILAHFSELARALIETDASDYAVAGVISQYSSLNLLHPVAFESQKLHNSELNYKIHDKELLAILFCLQKWHSYLLSLSEPFEFLTDHNALKYFMSSKVLTCLVVPDALSRRDDVYPREGKAFANNNPDNV